MILVHQNDAVLDRIFEPITISIFYLEQLHSTVAWNNPEKLYVAITGSPVLKTFQLQMYMWPVQAKFISGGGKINK